MNPLNLALRFLLELAALVAMGIWGYQQADGLAAIALAAAVPVVGAALWGVFRVPGDASHSGNAPVAVPGVARLALELAWFASAAWAFYDAGHNTAGIALAVIVAAHYFVSYDRVLWLIRRKTPSRARRLTLDKGGARDDNGAISCRKGVWTYEQEWHHAQYPG